MLLHRCHKRMTYLMVCHDLLLMIGKNRVLFLVSCYYDLYAFLKVRL